MVEIIRFLGDGVVRSNGLARPCCMPENMSKPESGGQRGTIVRRCLTCGAQHYEMDAEPGSLLSRPGEL